MNQLLLQEMIVAGIMIRRMPEIAVPNRETAIQTYLKMREIETELRARVEDLPLAEIQKDPMSLLVFFHKAHMEVSDRLIKETGFCKNAVLAAH
jgi:hypothetical protein